MVLLVIWIEHFKLEINHFCPKKEETCAGNVFFAINSAMYIELVDTISKPCGTCQFTNKDIH